MKKKTIEQKAKAYDEALECAKSALDCLADDYICTHLTKDDIRGMYAKFFPELGGNEDEKIRKSLSAYFVKFKEDDMWDNDFSFGDIVAWLEKQGEQKHAWSEEDEKILKDIITDVKFEGYNNDMQANSYKKTNWLKKIKNRVQLQSHWKPTEEQMDAVKCAALDVKKFSSRSEQLMLVNEPYYKALVSLYNDLKQL